MGINENRKNKRTKKEMTLLPNRPFICEKEKELGRAITYWFAGTGPGTGTGTTRRTIRVGVGVGVAPSTLSVSAVAIFFSCFPSDPPPPCFTIVIRLKSHNSGKMEGQNGCNNSVQMLSLKFGANVNIVSQMPGDCTNHHHVLPADRSVNQINLPNLTEWTQTVKTSPTFVEFIAETSNFPRKASAKDMLAIVPVNTVQAVDGVSEIHGEIPYNHPTGSYSSKPTDSRKNNAPGIPSKPRPSSSSRRGYSTDRQRRIRIAERLEALQELLPQSSKGNQASVLDDVIDHMKYLQLQIKDLSQSKLGGELSSEPFIFVEGYGHYMSHQEMQDEPLEEMVGKLLEVDPLAAAQLLENKGLFLMPMDFVEGLC